MMKIGLIGVGAGAAAALLFASVMSGAWLSVILFYLAPLPIMIAGLGWTHWAGLTASLLATAALGTVFGAAFCFAFFAGVGLPAWWLAYLSLLARPVAATAAGPQAPSLEWYPTGRLVVWAAVLAAAAVAIAALTLGFDAEGFRSGLNAVLSRLLQAERTDASLQLPGGLTVQQLIDFMVIALPPTAAVTLVITKLVNLWLAGRIVLASGRLSRPWPQLSAITFPPLTAAALAIAFALSFLDTLLGIVAGVVSASLALAYAILGFAVLHEITRGLSGRAFMLGGVYASVFVLQGWPILILCLIGLSETAFGLRARFARRRGPPAPTVT